MWRQRPRQAVASPARVLSPTLARPLSAFVLQVSLVNARFELIYTLDDDPL